MYIVESFFPPPAFCCCCCFSSSSSPPFSSIAPTSATDETKMERREKKKKRGRRGNADELSLDTTPDGAGGGGFDKEQENLFCYLLCFTSTFGGFRSRQFGLFPPPFFVFGGNRQRSNRDDNWKEKRNWIQPSIPE